MSERENPQSLSDTELDRLLQSALASYGGPDEALAERVLARVTAEPERKRLFRWLPWAIAVPLAAALILISLFSSHPLSKRSNQAHVLPPPSAVADRSGQSSIVRPAPEPQAKIARVTTRRHSVRIASKVAPLPKLQVFPTPQPLTPAERALAEYAARASQADRQALIETQKKLDKPLSIAAIQIQPLEPPEEGGN